MPDLFRQSIGSESLWYCAAVGGFAALRMRHAPCGYTKYICTFQTLSRQKISRRMLSLNRAVLPLIMPYCNTSPRLRQPREKAAPARKQEPPRTVEKGLAEFAPAGAKKMGIIFSGGVYVGENTARLANVRRARRRRALRALQRAAAPFKREPSETGLV